MSGVPVVQTPGKLLVSFILIWSYSPTITADKVIDPPRQTEEGDTNCY